MKVVRKVTLLTLVTLSLGFTINHMELNGLFTSTAIAFEHDTIDTTALKCPATTTAYTPDNTVILVDFHRVIAQLDIREALKNFNDHPQRFKT